MINLEDHVGTVLTNPTRSAGNDAPHDDRTGAPQAPQQSETSRPGAPKERHVWIDAARGLSVLAVVFFHVCLWHYWKLGDVAESNAGLAWHAINTVLGSVRMPLLLFLSGMLASSKVRSGSKRVVASVSANYYLYVSWLLIYGLLSWASSTADTPHHIESLGDFATQFLFPDTPLWYVFALAVYLTGLTLLRRVPPVLVILVLTAVYVVITVDMDSEMRFTTSLWYQIPRLAVFFALGIYGRQFLLDRVPTHRYSLVVLGTAAGVVLFAVSRGVPLHPLAQETLDMTRNLCLALASLGLVCIATTWTKAARVGQFFGQRTVGIYVLHFPLVSAVVLLGEGPLRSSALKATGNSALCLLYPLAVSALVVAACLLIEHTLRRLHGNFLFAMNDRLQQRIARL